MSKHSYAKYRSPDGLDGSTITAEAFGDFMATVWDATITSNEDGSITLHGSPLYDQYANAAFTAAPLGAIRTGATKCDDEHCTVFKFPSGARVAIGKGGASVTPLTPFYAFRVVKD